MKTEFNRLFLKDLDKLPTKELRTEVAAVIVAVENAGALTSIANVKKLRGYKTAYRIRVGDFRIGITLVKGTVEFVRIVNRKEIYTLFP